MTTETITAHPAIDAIRATLDEIGLDVATSYTLADAIREGSQHTRQLNGAWVNGGQSCALGAGLLSAMARGYVK